MNTFEEEFELANEFINSKIVKIMEFFKITHGCVVDKKTGESIQIEVNRMLANTVHFGTQIGWPNTAEELIPSLELRFTKAGLEAFQEWKQQQSTQVPEIIQSV